MKIFPILSILFLSQTSSFGQAKNKSLTISRLTGDFYIYTTYGTYKGNPVPSNSMYMVTQAGVVLFDTPWDSTQFQPLLDSIKSRHQKEVILCISTHFHADRTAGLEYYKNEGIKTYTTKRTDELSRINKEKRAAFLINNDTSFTIGQHKFQTYYGGQGHTPDNIVIWFENEKILYGGCLVKSMEAEDLGNLSDANVQEWTLTIQNIQHKFKSPKYIIPGHLDWNSTESLNYTLYLIEQYNRKK
jgi:metallo-beta-lactamase class B